MAQYPSTILTNLGIDLINESITDSKALIFTKVVMGDGLLAEGQDIKTMTKVINPLLDIPLTKGTKKSGQTKLRFAVSNSGLDTGFFAREVGIFAKVGDEGAEQLYAYTNGGNYVDYIPDKSNPLDEQIMDFYVVTGNAETVKIFVDNSAYITVADMEDHEADENAHSEAFDKHNKDSAAHSGIFVAILGGIMKGILYLIDPADDSNDNQGATTGWVRRMFKTLLKAAFDASGVQYNFGQNGFIKLGEFFGGFCLQWRNYTANIQANELRVEPLPIAFSKPLAAFLSDTDSIGGVASDLTGGAKICSMSSTEIAWFYNWNYPQNMMINIFAIGRV